MHGPLKVNNSGAAKVEYLTKKNNKKYKNPITSNIHACTPSSITHLDVYTQTIYKSVVFSTIGEVFATGCFTFNYRQRYARKDNCVLTPRYWFPILFSLYVVLKYKLQYQFIDLRNVPFSNWKLWLNHRKNR